MGGSGKTPVTIALAKQHEHSAIVLRGYGRASSGTIVVSDGEKILVDVSTSGDEAMLLAKSLPKAFVIVATNRKEGIIKAQELGAQVIWLDDGYSKHFIKKFDVLLEPATKAYLPFCLPAGPYREKLWKGKQALIVQEERDFAREVTVVDPTKKMLLITGISKPWRLDPYLPDSVIEKVYFPDHYAFTKEELDELVVKHQATSILTTQKDAVKMESFGYKLSILDLSIKVDGTITKKIDNYIKENACKRK